MGAEAGTLSIMVGGPDDLVAKALPYLKLAGNPANLGRPAPVKWPRPAIS